MPEIDFSEDLPFEIPSGSSFVRLTKRGEKIRFRLVKPPVYIAQHWISEKKAVDCERINRGGDCEWCEKFKNKIENPHHRSKSYRPSLQFFYPIVNRETGEAQIFQTTLSVYLAFKEASKAGIDVYKSDWQVTRNEGSPTRYYGVVRLDATPLSEKEKKALEEAREIDIEEILRKAREKRDDAEAEQTESLEFEDVDVEDEIDEDIDVDDLEEEEEFKEKDDIPF